MYFEMKNILKSNYYHTPKHTERNRLDVPKTEIGSTAKKILENTAACQFRYCY